MSEEFKESEASQAACENCSAIHDAASHYCPHCGAVSSDGAETCAEHPRREAVAHCVACESPMCDECSRETEGRFVCENDVGAADTAPWAVVFHSAEEWEVEARRQLLDQSHIPAVRFVPGSWGPASTGEHELRVPATRDDEAKEVLDSAEFSLVDGDTDWEDGANGNKGGEEDEESVH